MDAIAAGATILRIFPCIELLSLLTVSVTRLVMQKVHKNCAPVEAQTFSALILLINAQPPQNKPAAKDVPAAIDIGDNFIE